MCSIMSTDSRKVVFELDNVVVTTVGPMKDEASFVGKLMIIEESHGPGLEWNPLKIKSSDPNSPESECSEWEDVCSSVGYRASHNDSIDAVEIKAVRTPNVIKCDISDLKSYKRTDIANEHKTAITFLQKDGTNVPAMQFQNADFGRFCAVLDNYVTFKKSKKESNLYLLVDPKVDALEKSFSELDLFSDSKPHIIKKIIQDPYSAALSGFSKVTNLLTDYMIYGPEPQCRDPPVNISEFISENIPNVNIDNQEEPGYELITRIDLPPRTLVVRDGPMGEEEWKATLDADGRIADVAGLKLRIFRGGVAHSIRSEVWKYLLGFYDYKASEKERQISKERKCGDYFRMKLQWKSFTSDQETRFSALRDRRSLIEKDVSRTDRTHPYYEGENNTNLQMLHDILMTYCMHNFDLGYVQGMSDLLSPILVVMQDELDAFWCFTGWLNKIGTNFELEQQGMKKQLQDLHRILYFVDSQLCEYLEKHDSGNMFFAFRWLLILFKRDFKFMEIMRLWEVLWTELPCKNFHLLICIAILDSEKMTIMENEYGLTEILKHVNEMSYKINLEDTLCKAEAIYIQIKNSRTRSDVVETILGIDPLPHVEPAALSSPNSVGSSPNHCTSKSYRALNTTDSIDEYVDLENQFHSPFDYY